MIGKIKSLNFFSFFFLILFSLIINSFLFNNLLIVNIFLTFFFISILITKYGLEIIKQLNLIQNIRTDISLQHLNKQNTPTMGEFIFCLFIIILLVHNYYDPNAVLILFF